jgi:SAM-dependent methyltransferase
MDLRERPSTLTARHPWETVRAGFFCRVLAEPLALRTALRVVDVGAGDGFVGSKLLGALPDGSSVTCVDSEYSDAHLASMRLSAPRRMEFARTCPDREFDAIVLLDVLEHVADDRGFLREFVENRLRPGGLVLASVPAHQVLYTQHDVALGHHRRYSAAGLRDALVDAGLTLRRTGSLFSSLIVPRALAKAVERARGIVSQPAPDALAPQIATGISVWRHGRIVTSAIRGALELDARLSELAAHWSAPSVGLSVWALGERSAR